MIHNIPCITAKFSTSGNSVTVRADDGYFLQAERILGGPWIFDKGTAPPTKTYHLTLRKLIHEALNG